MPTQRTGTGVSAEFVDAQNAGLVDGIYTGEILAQVVPALSVRSVSLTVIRSGVKESIPDQSVAIGAAPGVGLIRCDMIQWNGTTLNAKAGTAAAIGTADAPTPDVGFIPLALVMVFNGDTTIRNMGFLDSSSASKGRIYAYYFARRGIYAASQAGQDSTATSGDDPEVILPVYHPRSSVVKIKAAGSAQQLSNLSGLQGTLRLDGTLITRSQAKNQWNSNTGSIGDTGNQDTLETAMPRAGVPAGAHRWWVNWIVRAAGQTLTYRLMELEEVL
jgi:hypothetical protein